MPSLGEITFAWPPALWALLAVMLPLLLWLRRRGSGMPRAFSSVAWLPQRQSSEINAIMRRNILIMLLRMALIVVMVLLAAQPQWDQAAESSLADGVSDVREKWVVVLDESQSMFDSANGSTTYAMAIHQLKHVLAQAESAGAAVTVVRTGVPPIAIQPLWTTQPTLLGPIVNDAQPTPGDHTLDSAIAEAQHLLQQTSAGQGHDRRIIVISDFLDHQTSFDPRNMDPAVHSIVVGEGPAANWSIDGITTEPRVIRPGMPVNVCATLTNHAGTARSAPLSLRYGEKTLTRTIDLEAAQTRQVCFTVPVRQKSGQTFQAEVHLATGSAERWTWDDHVELRQTVQPVLAVAIQADASDPWLAAWTTALDVISRGVEQSPGAGPWLPVPWSQRDQADVWIILDPAQMKASGDLRAVEQAIHQGMGCVIWPANREGWTSWPVIGLYDSPASPTHVEPQYLARIDPAHEPWATFTGASLEHLLRLKFPRTANLRSGMDSSVLAVFADGPPAMTYGQIGQGQYAVNSIAPLAGKVPLIDQPIFLPLVATMLQWVSPGVNEAMHSARLGHAILPNHVSDAPVHSSAESQTTQRIAWADDIAGEFPGDANEGQDPRQIETAGTFAVWPILLAMAVVLSMMEWWLAGKVDKS